MRRHRVLLRRVLVLSALACALLAVVLLRPSRTTAPRTDFPATFPDFDPAAVASVRVARTTKRDGKETAHEVVLERTGPSAWTVANRGGYPAKTSQVATLLEQVRDAKTTREDTRDPARAASFAGEDGWTEVAVSGSGGAPLARFGIGKSGAGGSYEHTYLRVGEEGTSLPGSAVSPGGTQDFRVVTAQGMDSYVRVDPEDWVDRDLWPAVSASDLVGVEIDQREKKRVVSLVRVEKKPPASDGPASDRPKPHDGPPKVDDDAESWAIEKPTPGPASPSAASGTAGAFANLSLETLVAVKPGTTDADFGFAEPTLVVTGKGRLLVGAEAAPTYVLTVGKKVEGKDSHYVRRGSEAFVFEVSKGSLKEFESEPDSWAEKPPEKPPGTPPGLSEPQAPDGEKPAGGPGGQAPPGTPSEPPPGAQHPPPPTRPGSPPGGGTPPPEKPPDGAPSGGAPPPVPPPPPAPPAMGGDSPR